MNGTLERHLKGAGGIAELFAMVLPLVISQACETIMMFTDRLFLARIGPENMSAAMGGGLTCFMFTTFFMGLTGYSNALVAQHLGAGQIRKCPLVVAQALLISLFAYPLVLAAIPAGEWLFSVSGIAPEQLAPQTIYYRVLTMGTIFGMFRNCLCSYFSGMGRTGIIMRAAITSMLVNVVANYILIFGKLGFPILGIRGAAYGTITGSLAGLLVVAFEYFGRRNRKYYSVMDGLRFDFAMMKKLIRLGYPSGLEFFLNISAFNFVIMLFHSYGLTVATAVTIAFNWDMLSFIPLIGVNIGVTSMVGRYMGAGNSTMAHRSTMSGLKLVCAYSFFIVLVFSSMPGLLVDVFSPAAGDPAFALSRPLGVFMVRMVSLYVFADSIGIVFSGALRGAGDTFMTMCLSVGAHWFMVLVLIPLIRLAQVSPELAWTATVVLIWIIGLAFYARYRTGRWRRITVVDLSSLSGTRDIA